MGQSRGLPRRAVLATLLAVVLASVADAAGAPKRSFGVGGENNRTFTLNGDPIRLMSGSLHYFRVHPDQWARRLFTMREMGLNAVDTYVAWSLHQPTPAEDFDTSGMLDLVRFIKEAQRQGLMVILRPGPYICSEFDLGGLPPWLLSIEGMKLRSSQGPFLDAVKVYMHWLFRLMRPLQWSRGGPIVMVQIENEFGHIGGDAAYLRRLKVILIKEGVTEMLVTSDAANPKMLEGGALPGKDVLRTINFGPPIGADARESLALLRRNLPSGPLMVMELWVGWFDHWGERHHKVPLREALKAVREVLDEGASFNLYMYHGGTNFGLTSGANLFDKFHPTTTSYDYDAPLSESGAITEKWTALRILLQGYQESAGLQHLAAPPDPPPPPPPESRAYGTVWMREALPLLDCLSALPPPVHGDEPLAMEKLPINYGGGQGKGLMLYRAGLAMDGAKEAKVVVSLGAAHDRSQIFIARDGQGRSQGISQMAGRGGAKIRAPATGGTLELLVENLGHVNMGNFKHLGELKGITQGVRLGGASAPGGWDMHPLELGASDLARWGNATCWVCSPPASVLDPIRVVGDDTEVDIEPLELPRAGKGYPTVFRGTLQVEKAPPAEEEGGPREAVLGDTWMDLPGAEVGRWRKGFAWVNGWPLGRYWEAGPTLRLYVPGPVLREGANEVVVLELHGPDLFGGDGFEARPVSFEARPLFDDDDEAQ